MKKIAGDYHRERRGNCAQSVAFAWGSKFVGARGVEEVFDGCGGGRVPGGFCGALHASCTLAGVKAAETIKGQFAEKTGGHLTCKELRAAKRVSCNTCVEIAAELLENHSRKI